MTERPIAQLSWDNLLAKKKKKSGFNYFLRLPSFQAPFSTVTSAFPKIVSCNNRITLITTYWYIGILFSITAISCCKMSPIKEMRWKALFRSYRVPFTQQGCFSFLLKTIQIYLQGHTERPSSFMMIGAIKKLSHNYTCCS